MPAVSKKQQRFFGMVRAAQKGEAKASSPEVARVAATASTTDVKKFASTKHKGLPEKKKMNEEGYDHLRDMGRVRPSKDKKDATSYPPSEEMKKLRKVNKGPSALEIVKKKYGKSVMKMEERDEYGDPVGGPKISKKQKAKNLSSNTPDEQHTTTTSEAKVDKPMIFGKSLARNERRFGKKGSTQPQGYFGQKPSQAAELSKKRTDEHKAKRGVKTKGVMEDVVTEKCWPGYEKKGMKTMFGKRYPNCVKKTKKESFSNWRDELGFGGKDSSKKIDEDWQKVNRKDKTDGLSQKAVDAYRRENPGSKLKTAVTKDPKKLKKGSKSAKRRLSFCRRMKGMKKKLTSAKTSRDPDSRINKALRRWNCSYEPTGTTITEKALSKKQQKFFGIVRAAQKGTLDGEASPQVQRAAADMKMKDVKKFASTKHKGLPEKVKSEK